ncbi:MAG: transposase [Actinobacteria bacterium]|nr:transposase [Actinomycetota bacterium]MBL7124201.1 transposase [Actinomycetota bacterium]
MKYIPEEAKITYRSKYSKGEKEFSALEWMATLCSHIPDRSKQTVRYYGLCKALNKP